MDSFNVILAPAARNQLDRFIDYIQYTLLNEYVEAVYHQLQDYENTFISTLN